MTHRIHIPTVGEKLVLAEPWTFSLYDEYRNKTMIIQAISKENRNFKSFPRSQSNYCWPITLPAGWELKITRVYIRQNRSEFDSVTFACPYNGKNVRFWVKLRDVNKMVVKEEAEHDGDLRSGEMCSGCDKPKEGMHRFSCPVGGARANQLVVPVTQKEDGTFKINLP